jgi:cation transport ATPase
MIPEMTDPDPASSQPTPPPTAPPPAPAPPQASPPSPAPARQGSWLDKRAKIALAFAAVEGLLLLFGRLSAWVVIAVAIPCVAIYFWRGREMRPGALRDALWVVAVSQVLIILAAIVSILIGTLVLILLGVFLGVAFLLLWLDEPSRR